MTEKGLIKANTSQGHRTRLKKRFANSQLRSYDEYEILEMLLFYSLPRVDTKPIAKELLRKFKSLAGVINASEKELLEIDGIGSSTVLLFKLLLDFYSRLFIRVGDKQFDVINNWVAVINYCKLTMGFNPRESFRVLYLNKKNQLIKDEIAAEGTIDKIHIYPREIARKALECSACGVILVHNHPTGDTQPSHEDILVTKAIVRSLETIGVKLLDHLIIGSEDHYSFKTNKLI